MQFKLPFTNTHVSIVKGFYESLLTFPFCRVIINNDSETLVQVLNVSIGISRET
jgi:hypothetical protein